MSLVGSAHKLEAVFGLDIRCAGVSMAGGVWFCRSDVLDIMMLVELATGFGFERFVAQPLILRTCSCSLCTCASCILDM